MQTCKGCRFYEFYYGDGSADDPERGMCNIPVAKVPLSMRGLSMAERDLVWATDTGCPTYEEKTT